MINNIFKQENQKTEKYLYILKAETKNINSQQHQSIKTKTEKQENKIIKNKKKQYEDLKRNKKGVIESLENKNKSCDFRVKYSILWPLKIFVLSLTLTLIFSIASEYIISAPGLMLSIFIILFLIIVNVLVDMFGVAVTACSKEPFLVMGKKQIKGAKESLILIKNAHRVSSICNDVISDICGIISGAAGSGIVLKIASSFSISHAGIILFSAFASALISGLIILGKAIAKNFAINDSEKIVLFLGKLLSPFLLKKKNEKKEKFIK